MQSWADDFARLYPGVIVQIQGVGSGSAAPALIRGTTHLAPMSRAMRRSELQAFQQRFGYPPVELIVANDALAVYVHQDNPLDSLGLTQLASIFSDTQHCGQQQSIQRWGQLGLADSWQARMIIPYGRNAVSGTYGFFKEQALCAGDVSPRVNEQPGSAAVVQAVGQTLAAIGYAGIGYQTASVKTLTIVDDGSSSAREFEQSPLTRPLYLYVHQQPGQPLDRLSLAFVEFILSPTGQRLAVQAGYLPLSEAQRRQAQALLTLVSF